MRLSVPQVPRLIVGILALAVTLPIRSQAFAGFINLWNFGSVDDGANAIATLVHDRAGDLYGTTQNGGNHGGGVAFELSPPATNGGTPSESILWNFGATPSDGANPAAGMIWDKSGNLYGTTLGGGAYSGGTVFELIAPSSSGGQWTESTLWDFGKSADGLNPYSGLMINPTNGSLYGTTQGGGTHGGGTAFKLDPPSASGGSWSQSVLWNFGDHTDGINPYASGLVRDKSGNLYGTTRYGGVYGNAARGGIVFELTPPSTIGSRWSESVVWNFGNGTDGFDPYAGVIIDSSGHLYGTTLLGGTGYVGSRRSGGTVFELIPPSTSGGPWTESILWNSSKNLTQPWGGLIMDTNGNLYGTTSLDCGTVFELSPPSTDQTDWAFSVLGNFLNTTVAPCFPLRSLTMDLAGNLFGTSYYGGTYHASNGGGTVFEVRH